MTLRGIYWHCVKGQRVNSACSQQEAGSSWIVVVKTSVFCNVTCLTYSTIDPE
jgi:hypothetical protein